MSGYAGIDAARAMLRRTIAWGAAAAGAVAVLAAVLGMAVAGGRGAVSGLVGAALAFLFLGLTAFALSLAGRLPPGIGQKVLLAWLLGGWFVKFALFAAAAIMLERQPWVVPGMLFGTAVVQVLASLVTDVIVFSRARIPIDPGVRR